ncbi:MAG: polymer-forming cytoskeletal protein [Caldilineaceae bacterium SB0675_bin_29]|uniref:Polymer-forming cytoskeletal protein n=1 Tax=Caldilineaceae bacterium SB0675_bin_29 TaxID=2605266 RepID=A0A6B1G410_9CHLR|nr:polymer-forming cytoskeletal protein [Caldilineaceae bacterium SB0675_bin_29]
MPLFKRGRKQDEEDLQWLYRNLQELDDDESAGEGAVDGEPAENDEDDVSAETAMESPLEPERSEPPPPEPVLGEPEPAMDEVTAPEPASGEIPAPVLPDPSPPESTVPEPPPVEVPTPVSRESLLSQEDVTAKTNASYERRSRQMSGNRRENAPFANRGQQPPQSRPQRQEPPQEEGTADTIVGPQSYFTGTFRSEKDLRVEGTLEGEIDCRGTVIVAKDATLSATVRARNIEIAGSVTGDVFIEERLHLRSSGEMRGQSHAASFIVEEGGYFEGEMKMGAPDQAEWPTIGSGSSSEGLGLSVESTQWSAKRSEGRPNRTGTSSIDSGLEDAGSGRHRSI